MKRFGCLILLLMLAGCAHVGLPPGSECEHLHPRLAYCLVAPAALAGEDERLDDVSIETPEGRHRFVAQVAFDTERTLVVGQTLNGLQLFRLEWDGQTLTQQQRDSEEAPDGRRLLALIQLAFAPREALNATINGGRVVDSGAGLKRERQLQLDDGRVIARIRYAGSRDGDIHLSLAESVFIRIRPLLSI